MDLSIFVENPLQFNPSRNKVDIYIGYPLCYSDNVLNTDTVELIFSDIGCNDYYNYPSQTTVNGGTIKLLIYQ